MKPELGSLREPIGIIIREQGVNRVTINSFIYYSYHIPIRAAYLSVF